MWAVPASSRYRREGVALVDGELVAWRDGRT
jgi:hypothetical protein